MTGTTEPRPDDAAHEIERVSDWLGTARRRVVWDLGTAAVVVVVMLATVTPFVIAWLVPDPLVYTRLPIAVLSPTIRPGGTLVTEVSRCASDPLSGKTHVAYTFTRSLVAVRGGVKTALPPLSSDVPIGCETIVSKVQAVPPDTPPGRYRLEGVSTAVGTWKTAQAAWWTDDFDVAP